MKFVLRAIASIFLFIIILNNPVSAQDKPHIIEGKVVDERGVPIPYATIVIYQDSIIVESGMTNDKGEFSIKTSAHGNLRLEVKSDLYTDFKTNISFNDKKIFAEPISLAAVRKKLPGVIVEFEKYKEHPGAVSEIDAKTLEQIAPIGTGEALSIVPGVNSYGDDGFGNSRLSVGIRGLNPRRSSRVLFMEDGIPLNPGIYIYPNMYYNPPVERIDEIEIMKGSSAIRFGPQTMGGVINYITNRPRDEFGGQSTITLGNNGYSSLFAEVGGWGEGNLKPEVQLLFKNGSGYRQNNEFQQLNATVKLQWKPKPDKSVYIKLNFNDENANATYTGLTEWSFENDPKFNPKNNDVFNVDRLAVDVIYHREMNDSLLSETKVYGSYFNRDWWRENDVFIAATSFNAWLNGTPIGGGINAQNPISQTDLVRVGNGVDNFGILREFYVAGVEQSYKFDHSLLGKKSFLDIGGRFHWERFHDEFRVGSSVDDRTGALYSVSYDSLGNEIRTALTGAKSQNLYTTAFSAFMDEKINLSKRLGIHIGTRFETFEQEVIDLLNGSSYTDKTTLVLLPGFGLNYGLDSMNFFAGVHRGFTPPSTGLFSVVNSGAINAENLVAEKSWNYEIGIRGNTRYIAYELSGFYLDIEDMVTAARSSVFLSLGEVSTKGLELGTKIKTSNIAGFLPDINLSYTFLKTRIDKATVVSHTVNYADNIDPVDTLDITGNELPYAPDHTITAGLSKEFNNGLTIRADMQYVGEVFTDVENLTLEQVEDASFNTLFGPVDYLGRRGDSGPVPSYMIFNASVSYELNDSWWFGLVGKNLTDKVYIASRLHSNPSRPDAVGSSGILVGPRLQVNLVVKYNF